MYSILLVFRLIARVVVVVADLVVRLLAIRVRSALLVALWRELTFLCPLEIVRRRVSERRLRGKRLGKLSTTGKHKGKTCLALSKRMKYTHTHKQHK